MGKNSQRRRDNKIKRENEKKRNLAAKINKMLYIKPDIFLMNQVILAEIYSIHCNLFLP